MEDADMRTLIRQHIDCEADTQLVIDTRLGEGVTVKPLNEFEHEHLRICRAKGLAEKDRLQAIRYAVSRLGADREVIELFDLLKFFFPWSWLPIRWRLPVFRYSAGTHTRLASAELIAEAFGFIQFPLLPLVKTTGRHGAQLFRRTPRLCLPKDFDQSPYFEIVKYPFIDFGNYSGQNLLPWKGSGVLSGEENAIGLSAGREQPLRIVAGQRSETG
jgi:hypothetical protein